MPGSPTKSSLDPRLGETPARTPFDRANRIFFRLYQSSNLMHKVGTRFVADYGATTQQWAVLGALARPQAEGGGMTVKDLLEFLLVSRQNLTPVLDRLEERGWVERTRDPADGRSRRIVLTPAGRRIWARMLRQIEGFYTEALRDFSPRDQAVLYRLLDRLKLTLSAL